MSMPREAPALVPSWLANLAAVGWRVLVTVALGVALLALALRLSTTLASLMVGLIVVATLAPFADRLRARGWSGLKVAAALTGALVLGVLGILVILIVALAPSMIELGTSISNGVAELQDLLASMPFGDALQKVLELFATVAKDALGDDLASIASSIATIATVAMLAMFMVFFLLLDGDKAWDASVRNLSDWRRERLTRAGRDAGEHIGGYLRGTVSTAILKGVVTFVLLIVLGVPYAAPLAVMVFLGGFVPYVGAVVTTMLLGLAAFGTSGNVTATVLIIALVVLYLAIRVFVTPRVYGRTAYVHPAVVLVALPIGLAVGGILGVVLAVPTIAVLAAVLRPVLEVLAGPDGSAEVSGSSVPLWLDRLAQWSWRGLVGLALMVLLVEAAATVPLVIGPIVVGVTLAATVLPARIGLQRRGLSQRRAAAAVATILWVSIVVVTILSAAALVNEAAAVGGTSTAIPDDQTGPGALLREIVAAYQRGLLSTITTVLTQLVGFGFFLILTALLSFYFLVDGARAWDLAVGRLSAWRHREVQVAGERGVTILGGYMIATGVLSGFNAITGWLIMTLLGLPLALPIAVLSFLGGFIPYIGQALTSLLAFFVAVKYGTTQDVIIMGVYTIVMNVVQGSFIAPLVYGRAVSIHPAIVLLAIPAGGELAGVLGMFLAVPVVGVFAAVWRNLLTALGEQAPAVSPTEAPTASPAPMSAAPPGPAPAPADT
jgi:predicted PurR-regulated permease PerM